MNEKLALSPEVVVQLGWLAFYSIAVGVTTVSIVWCIAFLKSENPAGSFTRMFERAQALKMVTVLLIVLSVLILALLERIAESATIGVLSGIAGYVLGGLEKTTPEANKEAARAP